MKPRARICLLGMLIAAAAPASAAGIVNVTFADPARYTDAGISQWEKDANLKQIDKTLQDLGTRFLRDGEVLKIEVLDVDLAGNVLPWRRSAEQVRIVRGAADWPRINMRYTLESDGKTVRSGSERVSDLAYLNGLSNIRSPEPLQYEKKMLQDWFRTSFAERPAFD